ncbi:MAG: hypothetical protein V8T45_11140 [Oscillospiraceae bacterium]
MAVLSPGGDERSSRPSWPRIDDIETYRSKIEALPVSEEIKTRLNKELGRLSKEPLRLPPKRRSYAATWTPAWRYPGAKRPRRP